MKRDPKIDIARGLGIFTVVAGHLTHGFFPRFFYIFNMQFFFMISGFFHRPNTPKKQYFTKKFFSLFIPYIIYLILVNIPKLATLFNQIIQQPTMANVKILANELFILAYGGAILKGVNGVFWFMTCLFFTHQVFHFIVNSGGKVKLKIIVTSIVFYGLSLVNQFYFQEQTVPWAANVVFYSFPFYAIGYLYGRELMNVHNRWLTIISVFFTASAIYLVLNEYQIHSILKYAQYGWPIYTPLAALAIVHLMLVISHYIGMLGPIGKLIAYSGRAAVTIIYIHQFLHFNVFPDLCYKYEWTMAIALTLICTGIHYLLDKNKITRALLFGAPKDQQQLMQTLFSGKSNPAKEAAGS